MRKTVGFVALAIGLAACSGSDKASEAVPPMGDAGIRVAQVVATTDAEHQPVDAVPSPDGATISYLATGDADAAVMTVPATGRTGTTLASGAPLAKPTGITVSTDGSTLFVADPASGDTGAVLVLSATQPGPATVLAGTQGYRPRGVDFARSDGGDAVYFTGTDPVSADVGLFRVAAAGGTVETVITGPPFMVPDAVVVGGGGVAYVSDQGAGEGQGAVMRVSQGTVTPVLANLVLGNPGGVTLIKHDTYLLVSSIDAVSRSDQVLFFNVATGQSAAATRMIGENKDSAGGLHRAHAADVLAWADVLRPGHVYRVDI